MEDSGKNISAWDKFASEYPEIAAEYDQLYNSDGRRWCLLLRYQPQFSDKCDWSKLSNDNWEELLEIQPQLEKYRK